MNFKSEYKIYSKLKFDCGFKNTYTINKIMFSSGGSINVIIRIKLPDRKFIILKIMPQTLYHNTKTKPNFDLLEIKFYQFFTQKYLLTDRTPHIVGIYNQTHCPDIKKFITKYLLDKKCLSIQDQLAKKIKSSESDDYLCDILLRGEMKLIRSDFYMVMLENCQMDLALMLRNMIRDVSYSKPIDIISELNRIFFQIIFTLSIIKDDYAGFLHGDFFVRNILVNMEKTYKKTDMIAYHYKTNIFYLPANGSNVKINDFGMSIIANKIEPNVFDPHTDPRHIFNSENYDPFSKKTDLFNFFIDTYKYISEMSDDYMPDKPVINSLRSFFQKFLDIKSIDKIPNKELLTDIWHINGLKILTDTLLEPSEYLIGDHFKQFRVLNPNSVIIKHYNL